MCALVALFFSRSAVLSVLLANRIDAGHDIFAPSRFLFDSVCFFFFLFALFLFVALLHSQNDISDSDLECLNNSTNNTKRKEISKDKLQLKNRQIAL